ncbi:MAG: thioredoxin domain-containing protein [Gammaproteobacteria bacterium]|nr:thioredoxin domain-containing protein [Gammaproteobacteria bacterium]
MSNKLSDQTSPYLLQHADNPVDWLPWNEESLQKARDGNKPILLSIGYSACHWCHVMAHESFEDAETAALMNRLFINIKVDREERPDLDKIYQTAHQVLTQRPGGWPLTLFLRPDNHMPFFAGTYYPKQPRSGMVSFMDLMKQVHDWYQSHPDELAQQNEQLTDIMQRIADAIPGNELPDSSLFQLALQHLSQSYDQQLGGFGKAPKFPHPTNLERLLRHWHQDKSTESEAKESLHMATFTLQQMALGGMYDQIGGGFCRYSVDDQWMIPHFEKMLYDNGPLLALYAQAYAATGNQLFKRIAEETADWVKREMQSPAGGYYSTLDADSEGEEGRFYVWSSEEAEKLLEAEEYAVFSKRFGLDRPANFEGKWNPHVYQSVEQIAESLQSREELVDKLLTRARHKLFEAREQRTHPGRDEKILTSWNGLMIRGMAIAAQHLNRPDYATSAQRALDFIHQTLWQNGRLLATHKDNKTHLNAYLDDYAYLIDGILELLQFQWRSKDLQFARELADVLLTHFEDRQHGGFYFTSDDHEDLIQRPKPYIDDAMPSGNGIAAYALQRLGHLLGEVRYLDAAERCLKAASNTMQQHPYGCMAMLLALEEHNRPVTTIIIRADGQETDEWKKKCILPYQPCQQVYAISNTETNLPAAITAKHGGDKALAYICTGTTCGEPLDTLDTILSR